MGLRVLETKMCRLLDRVTHPSGLGITPNQEFIRMAAFQGDEDLFGDIQKRFTILTDTSAQVRIPQSEFSSDSA